MKFFDHLVRIKLLYALISCEHTSVTPNNFQINWIFVKKILDKYNQRIEMI